jgi:hypothetical protein
MNRARGEYGGQSPGSQRHRGQGLVIGQGRQHGVTSGKVAQLRRRDRALRLERLDPLQIPVADKNPVPVRQQVRGEGV